MPKMATHFDTKQWAFVQAHPFATSFACSAAAACTGEVRGPESGPSGAGHNRGGLLGALCSPPSASITINSDFNCFNDCWRHAAGTSQPAAVEFPPARLSGALGAALSQTPQHQGVSKLCRL